MASYGHAIYGFSTYGVEHQPVKSNIGGLIRTTNQGETPLLVRYYTPDLSEATKTELPDHRPQLKRVFEGDVGLAIIRHEGEGMMSLPTDEEEE